MESVLLIGIDQDGKCLFIPFDSWDGISKKGDNQDGNDKDNYYHACYLIRAILSGKYKLGDQFAPVVEMAENDKGKKDLANSYKYYKLLANMGITTFANISALGSKPIFLCWCPAQLSPKQHDSLKETKKAFLNKASISEIGIFRPKFGLTCGGEFISYDLQDLNEFYCRLDRIRAKEWGRED